MRKSVTTAASNRVAGKRSRQSYTVTLSPKMSRELDEIAEWMGNVDVAG
jgi:hypothetical protein